MGICAAVVASNFGYIELFSDPDTSYKRPLGPEEAVDRNFELGRESFNQEFLDSMHSV